MFRCRPLSSTCAIGAAVEKAVAALPHDFAAIDVLVNDAGLAVSVEPAHKASIDDSEHLKGLMYLTC